jgi:hypothetical protein
MTCIRLQLVVLLCAFAWPTIAADMVSEEESQRYYFSPMQKAQTYSIHPSTGREYLRGVWRLDRRAHVGGGHYARADEGDDVTLICNDERLIQIDFNRNHDRFMEFTEQLSKLTVGADGSMHFGEGKRYLTPLDDNHMAVTRYDYIVVPRRMSGTLHKTEKVAYPVDSRD